MEVGSREPEDSVTRVDKKILASVVRDQALTMVRAVELDDKSLVRVVQVSPPDEVSVCIVEVRLDLGPRQSRIDEEPTQARLHRRLRRRRELGHLTEAAHAVTALGAFDIALQPESV